MMLLLAEAPGWARTQAQSSQDQKPASLEGIVIDAVTQAPLNHVHVALRNYSQRTVGKYGALSTSDGRFSIKAMAPGTYYVGMELQAYLMPRDVLENGGQQLVLKSGEQLKGLVLKMLPPAAISGRVVDENGDPIEASIEVIGNQEHGQALTDDRGEFRISGLRAGKYLVKALERDFQLPPEVRTDGTIEVNHGPTYYPSSLSKDSATKVQAQAGAETRGIEIRLVPMPILRVSGTVSGVLPGAQWVSVELRGDPGLQSRSRVGTDRKFTIWRLPPGTYWLSANCLDPARKLMISAPVEINLTDASIDDIDLAIVPPFAVSGKVEGEFKFNEQKHAGARLELIATGSGQAQGAIEADGTFKLENVQPGRYRVAAVAGDIPENIYIKSLQLGPAQIDNDIIDFSSGPPRAPLIVTLRKSEAAVSGVVHDQNRPAPRITVQLISDNGHGFDLVRVVQTEENGSYAFQGVAPGKYRILAFDQNQYSEPFTVEGRNLFGAGADEVQVGVDEKVSQDLKLTSPDDL
jgi:5-hydroxyisourate hydrolase-like protein (transthyretin family)